jgi:hypothetical protein
MVSIKQSRYVIGPDLYCTYYMYTPGLQRVVYITAVSTVLRGVV